MKRSFNNKGENSNFNSFDALTTNEMMQIRGGDAEPKSRDKDKFENDVE